MKNLGRTLAEARKSLNLTQWEVAEQLNVARTTVSNWEVGRSQPDYRALCKLSELFNRDLIGIHSDNNVNQEANTRKMQLKLSDSSVIEVISRENACNFTAGTVDFRIIGSDLRGFPVEFHVFADFSINNTVN